MKALLLLAHGSRRKQSNVEVVKLIEKIKGRCSAQFEVIYPAFLELSSPSIPEGIKMCADDGATSILVLPYFLNSGRHVHEDIPNLIIESKKLYPNICIETAPHIGASDLIVDALLNSIELMS